MPQSTHVIRRAIILAAGLGSRLQPITARRPKPLVQVHGVPILHNALLCLAHSGIEEVTIVVGYRKEAIIRSCGHHFAGVEITYCESPLFDRTGSAYSLWLARDALSEDTLLLEGDVFFEPEVLSRLLTGASRDSAAIAPFDATMSGSAVTLSASNHVQSIHMNQTGDTTAGQDLFKTLNLFKFSAETLAGQLRPALDRLIQSGAVTAYVEQLLKQLVEQRNVSLDAVHCGDLKWFEIDSLADLCTAEAIFGPGRKGDDIRAAE